MDKLKRVLSGQDTDDQSGLAEVAPRQPPGTCRPRGGLAQSPRAPRWRPEGGWRLARDGRRGRSGGAGPAVLPLHAGRKRVNK